MKSDKEITPENRHKKALEYAIDKIVKWNAASYINAIYLYGSYARRKYRYDSDVDIYIECKAKPPKQDILYLKGAVLPEDERLPEVDVKFGFSPLEEYTDFFHENIRKDGILLWRRKSTCCSQ